MYTNRNQTRPQAQIQHGRQNPRDVHVLTNQFQTIATVSFACLHITDKEIKLGTHFIV